MDRIHTLTELFIKIGVSFQLALNFFVYLIPALLASTVPMAVLMGILAGLSRLSSDSEIVAFKTSGISYKRLLWPVFIFSFGGWLFTSFLTLYLAPRSYYKWEKTLTAAVLKNIQVEINPREFNKSIPQMVIFIQDITHEKDWKNFFIYFSEPPEEPRVILAEEGKLNLYPELKRATIELFHGTLHSYPRDNPEKYSVTSFEQLEEEVNVEWLYELRSKRKRVIQKDITELLKGVKAISQDLDKIREEKVLLNQQKIDQEDPRMKKISISLGQKNKDYFSHWVEIHKKFAIPFVCLIFGLLGLPLGASTRKGGRTSGFTISLVIILIYYILITAGENIAMDGKISPFLGIWGPNIILFLAAAYLFFKSWKELPLFSSITRFFRKRRKELPSPKKRNLSLGWPRLSLRFPNILDRYIIRKYLAIFFLGFLTLLFISIIVTFFERIDNVYEHDKPLSLFFEYIGYRIPEFIQYILPVTAMTSALLTLGLLSKFNEITAMKACGISLYRIIIPVVLMAVLLSLFSFYLQENILPYSNKKEREVWYRINDVPPRRYIDLERGWVLSRGKDRIYHYDSFDPQKALFSQLSIFDIDLSSWSLKRRIYSEKGYLRAGNLSLENCWVRHFLAGKPERFESKKEMNLSQIEEKAYFLKELKKPDQMNYGELREYIREVEEGGFDTVKFRVDLHYKVAFPFVSLIMTLLGIPFAFSMGKRGALVGIGLSIVIAMAYWGALEVFRQFGTSNFLPPFIAAWGPNIIFGLVGLYLLLTLRT